MLVRCFVPLKTAKLNLPTKVKLIYCPCSAEQKVNNNQNQQAVRCSVFCSARKCKMSLEPFFLCMLTTVQATEGDLCSLLDQREKAALRLCPITWMVGSWGQTG